MRSSTSSSEGRGPGRLLLRVVLFGAVVLGLLALAAWIGPHASHIDYLAGLRKKHERLDTLASPKVVVIGGSSAAFSIDSRELERALCRPVVNMAIHADLGFRFMVDEVKGRLGKGDVVIVCLEQDNFTHPEKYTDVLNLAVDRDPGLLCHVPGSRRAAVVLGTLVMRVHAGWGRIVHPNREFKRNAIYRADAFDERGDLIGYEADPSFDTLELKTETFSDPLVGEGFAEIWNGLQTHADRAGATVVVTWPAIARSSYDASRDAALFQELERMELPLISTPEEYVLPDTAFLDTPYHLKAGGKAARMQRLITELCATEQAACCQVR